MAKWRFYSYDVWGRGDNALVNDIYKTDLVLELSKNPRSKEVANAIKQNIGDKILVSKAVFTEDAIWLEIPVNFTDENGQYHYDELEPYGELRREA